MTTSDFRRRCSTPWSLTVTSQSWSPCNVPRYVSSSALGIRYLGVCCGAGPHHIRALAEALGRQPESSKYSADMSKHAYFGTDKQIRRIQRDYRAKL